MGVLVRGIDGFDTNVASWAVDSLFDGAAAGGAATATAAAVVDDDDSMLLPLMREFLAVEDVSASPEGRPPPASPPSLTAEGLI